MPTYDATAIGDETYAQFAPLVDTIGDPSSTLQTYLRALGGMLQEVDDIAKDGGGGTAGTEPGWSQIFDLARAKNEWLPWLGQWVGYRVQERGTGENEATWRAREVARIQGLASYRRGTVGRLEEAVKEHLSGTQTVIIMERAGADANAISVSVYTSEVSTTQALLTAAALREKAAGLIMNVYFIGGASYTTVTGSQASYSHVATTISTYASLLANPTQ